MGAYQLGSKVGTVVGPDAPDNGATGSPLGPDSAAGQALWLAVAALAILVFVVGRAEGSITGKLGRAIEFVVIVTLAGIVGQWAARTYAGMHPDGPFAAGVRFDL